MAAEQFRTKSERPGMAPEPEPVRAGPGERPGMGPDGRTVVDLLKKLRDETTDLIRQEFALAKAELAQTGKKYALNAAAIVVGGALGYAALLFLLAAATVGLMFGLVAAGMTLTNSSWLAPLIVGVVVGVIAYALIHKGIRTLRRESPAPERTVQSMQENTQWLKHKLT